MINLRQEINEFFDKFTVRNNLQGNISTKFGDLNNEGGGAYQSGDSKLIAGHISNYSAVLHILKQKYLRETPVRIMELGCGSGLFSVCFTELLGERVKVTAGDYNKELISYANGAFSQSQLEFRHLNALNLPGEGIREVEVIFCCELWEHFDEEEQRGFLDGFFRNLNEDTVIIFTTPDLSAYRRGKSNYYAHKKERAFRELKRWLEDEENNPFRSYKIYRLVNHRLTRDLVSFEDTFGYYLNTLYKQIYHLSLKTSATRRVLDSFKEISYRVLGKFRKQKMPEEYFETYLVDSVSPEYDTSSFSLVVVLE